MATVIYKPGDKRWGEIGQALGQQFYERAQKKEAEREQKRRQEAYKEALTVVEQGITSEEDFNSGRTYKQLAEHLNQAGASDELDNMMEVMLNARAERQKKETLSSYAKNLPKDSPAYKRMQGMPENFDSKALNEMADFESKTAVNAERGQKGSAGERELTAFNQQGGERKVFVPKTVEPGQEDAFIREKYGADWTTTKSKEEKEVSQDERRVTAYDDKGSEREVFVPESVPPEGIDAYVKKTYGEKWNLSKSAEKAAGPNAKDIRDVEAELMNRGVSNPTPSQKAAARNVVNNGKEAIRYVAQSYGKDIVTDPLGNISDISFRGEDARIKYKHAATLTDDYLFEGMSPADAAMAAEKEAELYYKTGEFLDSRTKNSGDPNVIAQALDERGITDPGIVNYINAANYLKVGQEEPSRVQPERMRAAHEIVLKTQNPDASEQEIKAYLDNIYGAK